MPKNHLEFAPTEWAGHGSHFVGACFDEAKPYLDKDFTGLPLLTRFVAAQLFIECTSTSISSLILVAEGKEWDADVLSRSVMEGTIKFAYMLLGTQEEIVRKTEEYWNILPQFSEIRHNYRAAALLDEDALPEHHRTILTDLLIENDVVEETGKSWSRAQRKSMQQTWSLTGLLNEFANSNDSNLQLLRHLSHGYGMSSHLLHKDADGVGMVLERSQRSSERKAAVTIGHMARIISDQCAFAKLRLHFLFKACDQKNDAIKNIEHEFRSLFVNLKNASDNFQNVEYGEHGVNEI